MSRKTIILPKGRRARGGAPWIFSNEIRMDEAAKAIAPGAIVNVRGEDGRDFGTGYFNPKSLIAVRLLADECGAEIDADFFAARMRPGAWRCARRCMTGLSTGWSMPKATGCRAW